jgi:CubicO group peptidase (beta-lactamase class C family)
MLHERRAVLMRVLCILIFVLSSRLSLAADEARILKHGTPDSAGMDPARLEQAVALYRAAVSRDELRGTVLMVARHGTIVIHEAIGWKHRGYRLPMEKDTLFRLASNTKPVVAAGTLILMEEGKLSLRDKVAKYFESFTNWRAREITVFHLLTHTSGFRIAPIFYPFDQTANQPSTLRLAIDKFGKEGSEVEPGTSYSYSNPGYNTVGALIEQVSGMSLEDFLRKRIYEPLGMEDTLNHEDPAKLHRMATVYRGIRGAQGELEFRQGFTPDDPPDFPIIRASGGMISTAMDYGKFLQMYLNGGRYGKVQIISRDSVKKATSPHAKIDADASYGLGWSVTREGVYSHGGSDGTLAWVDPAHDLFALVFTHSPGGKNPSREFQKLVSEACVMP